MNGKYYLVIVTLFFSSTALAAAPRRAAAPVPTESPQAGDAAPTKSDPSSGTDALGSAFESAAAGISLRPPADCKIITRTGSGDEIAQFVQDQKAWNLRVSRLTLRERMGLTTFTDN